MPTRTRVKKPDPTSEAIEDPKNAITECVPSTIDTTTATSGILRKADMLAKLHSRTLPQKKIKKSCARCLCATNADKRYLMHIK